MTDLLVSDPAIEKSAVISDCGLYRYTLTRRWSAAPLLPFVMLNPSTADADIDDPTIRRCMGFARRENMGGILVANLYALRATSPKALWAVEAKPIGKDNWSTLLSVAMQAEYSNTPIVCAWGAHARREQSESIVAMFSIYGVKTVCLGKTKADAPRHPLYVRADQPLEPFP